MAERREYRGAAAEAKLSGSITPTSTSLTINTNSGWPSGSIGPFTIVVDPQTSSEEKIKCSGRSGSTITVASGGRGADGTSAATHQINAITRHIISAGDMDLANKHAADVTQDDHSQYMHNTIARTVSALHNFTGAYVSSGNPVFSGNPVLSGTPHFTGTPIFDHMGGTPVTLDMAAATIGATGVPSDAGHKHALNKSSILRAMWEAGDFKLTGITGSIDTTEWLECNGQAVSRTSYPALFAAFGTIYGAGDGVSTFNVPDYRDCILSGAGSGGSRGIGATGGQNTYTLQVSNLPAHHHDMSHGHSASQAAHDHNPVNAGSIYQMVISSPNTEQNYIPHNGFGDSTSNTQVTYSHMNTAQPSVTVNNMNGNTADTGSGTGFSIVPVWRGVRVLVKAH